MKKIAIIPARAGSKGLPNKNVLLLGDKPLIAHTIEAAIKSQAFERVIVTTDSLEYKFIAESFGAEVMLRGEELANDKATSFMVIEDVLKRVADIYDYFVLLQPTSPFRNEIHINEAIDLFEKNANKFNFLVSMTESYKAADLVKVIEEDQSLKNYDLDFSNYRRQSFKEYHPNGAIFLGKIAPYLKQKHFFSKDSLAYIMKKEDSLDIDDRVDFEMAIALYLKKNSKANMLKFINHQIKKKEPLFGQTKDITLLGHSIMYNWKLAKFNGYEVNNLGICGISTNEYQEFILDKKKIKNFGKYVIVMLGTNDIVYQSLSDAQIVNNIARVIDNIKAINPQTQIYFLEMTAVAFRMDRPKEKIYRLNALIKERIAPMVNYVELNPYMTDNFGNLELKYTFDGLHLTELGYEKIEEILGALIK